LEANGTQKQRDWRIAAGLTLVVIAAFANSLGNGFAMDANTLVLKDPRIRQVTAENLRLIAENDYWWPTYTLGVYRPVTTFSYLVNWAVLGNGDSAAGYHFLNLLLHGLNAWLVYLLALRVLGGRGAAFFGAALWAAHPVGVECVASVSGRADLLAAAAVLAGFILYTRGAHWAAMFAVATVGVFAKENAAVLIGLMVLWDFAFHGFGRRRLSAYGAVAASLAVLWGVRYLVYRDAPWTDWPVVDNPLLVAGFWTAKWTAIKVIGMCLWLLVWPWRLAYDRSFDEISLAGWNDAGAWLAMAVISALLAAAIVRKRRDPVLFFAAGWFGIAFLPNSNLLLRIGNIMTERSLYLPAVAFAIAVAALGSRLKPGQARTAAAAALIVVFAGRTFARNPAWRDNDALARSDVETAPRSFRVHEMLAQALHGASLDAAIREEERAWEILRGLPTASIPVATPMNLGGYYLEKGDLAGREWYEKAIAILLRGREISNAAERAWDEAQRAHGRPLVGRSATPNLFFSLGQAYGSLGRYQEALEALQFGHGIDPSAVQFYEPMAAAWVGLGRKDQAAMVMEEKRVLEGGGSRSCAALADLAAAWDVARRPDQAAAMRARAQGCS
jgi:tetratricopeptide (TPR) repeat protein